MDALTKFRKSRAFREGHDARVRRAPRREPASLGEFDLEWLLGWDSGAHVMSGKPEKVRNNSTRN